MHHFTKHLKKKLWFRLFLPLSSAFITVAVFDLIACCSWLCKDYGILPRYSMESHSNNSTSPLGIVDILYWIFVTYRVILSLLLCIGGIFMGRRVVVVLWLSISMIVDTIHLSETIFVLSKPHLVQTWPVLLGVLSSIWGEVKIIRIKYRIIRRSFMVDWNNNSDSYLGQQEQHNCRIRERSYDWDESSLIEKERERDGEDKSAMCSACKEEIKIENASRGLCFKSNVVHFIKLARNLYNLLTWHLTGFLFGGDFHTLISKNYKALFLEEKFVRYARVFLDALTIVYILQERKFLVTPWITIYILFGSGVIAVVLFTLLQLNLLTSLFSLIYFVVFSIDVFFRAGFIIFCLKLIVRRKTLI